MFRSVRAVLPLLLVAVLALGCDEDDPVQVEQDTYSGITMTDQDGNILDNDPNDWKTTSLLIPGPAFPNPAAREIVLPISTTADADVSIVVRTRFKIVRTIGLSANEGVPYSIVWDQRDDQGEKVPDGMYRVVFSAVAPGGQTHTTHGDVQMKSTP